MTAPHRSRDSVARRGAGARRSARSSASILTRGRCASRRSGAATTTPTSAAPTTAARIDLVRDPVRISRERRCSCVRDLEILVRVEAKQMHHRLRVRRRRVRLRQHVCHPLAVAGDRRSADAAPARIIVDSQRFLGRALGAGSCRTRGNGDDEQHGTKRTNRQPRQYPA